MKLANVFVLAAVLCAEALAESFCDDLVGDNPGDQFALAVKATNGGCGASWCPSHPNVLDREYERKDTCEAVGMRLCTIEELESNWAAGTGCGSDNIEVWSSTPCRTDYKLRVPITDVCAFAGSCESQLVDCHKEGGCIGQVEFKDTPYCIYESWTGWCQKVRTMPRSFGEAVGFAGHHHELPTGTVITRPVANQNARWTYKKAGGSRACRNTNRNLGRQVIRCCADYKP